MATVGTRLLIAEFSARRCSQPCAELNQPSPKLCLRAGYNFSEIAVTMPVVFLLSDSPQATT
jgi:hypothetical protein